MSRQGGSGGGLAAGLVEGGKDHEVKEREEKMENGDSENNNNIDKNKNGNISPEPDSHTLFSNGENQEVLNQN